MSSNSKHQHPSATSRSGVRPTAKPVNVFSNDGSFLELFQRTKQEEEDKKKEEALARKRDFEARFRNRGKRPPPDDAISSNTTTADGQPAKKLKCEKPLTDYEKQVNSLAGRSLKDDGTGIRPLVK